MPNDSTDLREELIMPSTIEDIDAAMLDYINNDLNKQGLEESSCYLGRRRKSRTNKTTQRFKRF